MKRAFYSCNFSLRCARGYLLEVSLVSLVVLAIRLALFFFIVTHTHTHTHTHMYTHIMSAASNECGFCTRLYSKKKKKFCVVGNEITGKQQALTWLIQFVKDQLPPLGWANFFVLFLVQRPAFPIETILAFVGRTASHLHHCRHQSFFLNLQHRLVLWCRGNIAQKHNWARGTCWDGDEARRRCPM